MSRKTFRRRGATLALCAFAALAAPAAACDQPTSQPFTHWLDYSHYAAVPGGDFEAGSAAWSLDGAGMAAGNETFEVAGPGDSRSLSIPRGASATSPSFCAGLGYPTVRLFAKGGGLLGLLNVTILYTDGSGLLRSQPLGVVTASGGWQPSLPAVTLAGLPLLTGSQLAIRLTAIGGSFSVDDVYVDPYGRH